MERAGRKVRTFYAFSPENARPSVCRMQQRSNDDTVAIATDSFFSPSEDSTTLDAAGLASEFMTTLQKTHKTSEFWYIHIIFYPPPPFFFLTQNIRPF